MRSSFLSPLALITLSLLCACSGSDDNDGPSFSGPCGQCTKMQFKCGWGDSETDYCLDRCNERQETYTDVCQREYDEAFTCFNDDANWECDYGLTGCQDEISEFDICATMPCPVPDPACEVCDALRESCNWDYNARCNCLSACGNDLTLEGDCQEPLDALAACVGDASNWTCDGSPPSACDEERNLYRHCTAGQPGWECELLRDSVGTWTLIPELPAWVNALAADANGWLFAATGDPVGVDRGVFISKDDGTSWTPTTLNLPEGTVASIAIQGTTLYAVFDMLVFTSSDAGATWTQTGPDMLFGSNPQIAADPFVAGRLYGLTMEGPVRSDNAGQSWTPIVQGLPTPTGGMAMVSDLIPAPDIADRLFAVPDAYGADGYGVYRSDDAGTVWAAANAGIQGLGIDDLLVGPGGRLWAIAFDDEVYASQDGAQSWTPYSPSHPCVHDFAGPSRFALGQKLFLLVDTGDLLASDDEGTTWSLVAKHTQEYGLGQLLFVSPSGNVVLTAGDDGAYRASL